MPSQLVFPVRRKQAAEHLFTSRVTFVRERSRSAWMVLTEWHRRSRGRRRLSGFNDRLLADIGINRTDAEAEAAKWFWQR